MSDFVLHLAPFRWSKSPATHWNPLSTHSYTQHCLANQIPVIRCNKITRSPTPPQIHHTSHSTLCQEPVPLPSVERQNAWEDKQSTSPQDFSRRTLAEQLPDLSTEGAEYLPEISKKSVSFSRKLPTHRKTYAHPSPNQHKKR